jgi:23S rRNA (cytidine1920-2'-O)/16S rRNA (cytidine1409-2'-O)-methyltransferase
MTSRDKPIRLDLALVARGLATTRSQARDLILRGEVSLDGATATRPNAWVRAGDEVVVARGAAGWVSRGALKLLAALGEFGFDPAGRTALDVGASTGGFTQILLQRGARRVYAVDVGRDQLHASLADDPRVTNLSGHDARSLTNEQVPDRVGAIVADVSFISLTKALPAALALTAPGCWLVVLIKPQFEAGRSAVGKGGVVRKAADRERAVADVLAWFADQAGWRIVGVMPSPIAGGSGNEEFLLGAVRDV